MFPISQGFLLWLNDILTFILCVLQCIIFSGCSFKVLQKLTIFSGFQVKLPCVKVNNCGVFVLIYRWLYPEGGWGTPRAGQVIYQALFTAQTRFIIIKTPSTYLKQTSYLTNQHLPGSNPPPRIIFFKNISSIQIRLDHNDKGTT